MKHLELAERYFEDYGKPIIERDFPQLAGRYAAGLAGEGSGCFGFDDEISQDHDFGPGFCIWLEDHDYEEYGEALQRAYDSLPAEFMGFSRSNIIDNSRLGVMKTSDFYMSFTGCPAGPRTDMDWFLISESNLAAVTNGKVFVDGPGRFTEIREDLLRFYPRDVLLKKLAARAAVISQAGQYNYPRCLKRGDAVAASLALARFTEAVISMVHLMAGKATPFYKWVYTSMLTLTHEDYAVQIAAELGKLPKIATDETGDCIEKICELLAKALCARYDFTYKGNFLQDYLPQLMGAIENPEFAAMHPMADCL